MKQSVFIPGIALLVMLSAARGNAQQPTYTNVFNQIQNSKDIEGARAVVLREIEGCLKGNVEQVMSCYDADNVVFYHTGANQDPKTWIIWSVGRDDILKYAAGMKDMPARMMKTPGIMQTAEIQHVDVKSNNALVVARYHLVTPDKEKGKTTTTDWESVFFLKKNAKGEWKINGGLGGATWKREITDLVTQ